LKTRTNKFIKRNKKIWDEICRDCHDHSKLDEIFKRLYEISEKNSFVSNIFTIVLFHQSVHGILCYRPVKALDDEELKKYMPHQILSMLDIFLYNDSYSYSVLGEDKRVLKKHKLEVTKEVARVTDVITQ